MSPDTLYRQFEKAFRDAIRPAIDEAHEQGSPRLADMLGAMRDLMLAQSPEAVRSQLERMGIATFTAEQARALIAVAGQEMARQVVMEVKSNQRKLSDRIWQSRGLRWTVIGGVVMLLLMVVTSVVSNFVAVYNHTH